MKATTRRSSFVDAAPGSKWMSVLASFTLAFGACSSTAQICGQNPVGILAGPITPSAGPANPSNKHQYYLLEPSCWSDAEATAVSMGGHLVTINDLVELTWVRNQFTKYGGVARGLWIGLHDPDPTANSPDWWSRRAEFVWSSGQPITTTAWATGEPAPPSPTNGFCVQMLSPELVNVGEPCGWAAKPDETLLNGVVEIPQPLEIATQPQSTSAGIGCNVRFSVMADGTTPVRYQWQFNNTDLPGANGPTLILTNVQPNHTGPYRVIVSNDAGTLESAKATLSVSSLVVLGQEYGDPVWVPSEATNVVAVAVGAHHAIALRKDGKVVQWSEYPFGQYNIPADVSNAIGVAAGYTFSVVLQADGTVACWGLSMQGETNVPAGLADVTAISAQADHSLALRSNGTVVAWGNDSDAQCAVPFGLSDVVAVAAGGSHSLALKADGTVVAWGGNQWGQAGVPANLSNVVAIAAGWDHSVALRADGSVVAWGGNKYGQTSVPAGLEKVVAINASDSQTLALMADGSLASWGYAKDFVPPDLPHVTGLAASGNFIILGDAAPHFTVQPWSRRVNVTSPVMLTAKAVSTQPMSYQWQLNGTDIPLATQDTLSIPNAQITDSGLYTLVVSNELGMRISQAANLEVSAMQNHAPMLKAQPDRTINAATHLTVANAALDTDLPGDRLSYQLIEAPAGATIDAEGTIRWTPAPNYMSREYVFTTVVTDDGMPPLSATNSFKVLVLDWAHSGPVGITAGPFVYPANSHQYFLLDPASWTDAEATAVAMGGHLVTVNDQEEHIWLRRTFSSYDGVDRALWTGLIDPDPSITWDPDYNAWMYHFRWASGQPITFFCWSTAGQPSQGAGRIKMVQPDPLWAWNQAEWAEEAEWVRLNGVVELPLKLQFLAQPKSTSVGIGRSVTLSVVADSTAPISYQWQFMGADLPGETKPSLTIANAQPAHSGPYRVVISNVCGRLVSDTVFLSVAGIVGWGISACGVFDVPTNAMNVVAISSGSLHSLALKEDRTIVAWGDNRLGQTDVPAGLRDVIKISAGGFTSLALTADGTVVGWGSTEQGELDFPAGLRNVTDIAAANGRCLALKADGTVVAWGARAEVPAGLNNVVAIATGSSHSMALKADGTVETWGAYAWTSNEGVIPAYVPADLTNVVAIAAGGAHTMALRSDGTVIAWGYDSSGETKVPPGLNNVVAISAGIEHSLALKADGAVVEWGSTVGDVSQPKDLPNAVAIAAGDHFSLALLRDGAPHLTVQPWDQSVPTGNKLSFSAKAVGAQSMSYQWRFNGNDIPGATKDTYSITDAQPAHTGEYTVAVANPLGTTLSRSAKLKVSRQPVALTAISLTEGRFQLRVSGPLGSKYILQTSADLAHWKDVQTNTPAVIPFDFVDPGADSSNHRFHRVRVDP